MRRPNAVVRNSHNRRVGQLDDVPEFVDALAQTPDGAVQVPQNVVNLTMINVHSIHFRMMNTWIQCKPFPLPRIAEQL